MLGVTHQAFSSVKYLQHIRLLRGPFLLLRLNTSVRFRSFLTNPIHLGLLLTRAPQGALLFCESAPDKYRMKQSQPNPPFLFELTKEERKEYFSDRLRYMHYDSARSFRWAWSMKRNGTANGRPKRRRTKTEAHYHSIHYIGIVFDNEGNPHRTGKYRTCSGAINARERLVKKLKQNKRV